MSFITDTNLVFTNPSSTLIANNTANEVRNTALGEQHIVSSGSGRDVRLTFTDSPHAVRLIAFLNVSGIGDNYPVLFEGLSGAGILDDVTVTRAKRANGNYDFYCVLADEISVTSSGLLIQWTAIPNDSGWGAVWVSNMLRPKYGVAHSWPLGIDDASETAASSRQLRYAGGRYIFETVGATFTFDTDYDVFGEPKLGKDIALPAPTTASGWTVDTSNNAKISGDSGAAETIATWTGVLTSGKTYQVDYQRNGAIFSSAFDTEFEINDTTGPLARSAVTFTASSSDLVVEVTGQTNTWDFEILHLREVARAAPAIYMRKVLQDAGKQQPVLLNIKDDELHDLANQTWYGVLQTPTQIQPNPSGGSPYTVDITLIESL